MAFYPNRKNAEDDNISPGSLGAKINKYRELRNLSQRELGILCGFKETTADSRIAQYEKMKRTPGEEVLCDIAKALGISRYSLYETDLVPVEQMFQVLFDIEDFHGLHPEKIGNEYYLVFDKENEEFKKIIQPFLKRWYEYKNGNEVTKEFFESAMLIESTENSKEYKLWRAGYPGMDDQEYQKYIAEKKMDKLQEEMDAINAKAYSKETKQIIESFEVGMMETHFGEDWLLVPGSIVSIFDIIGECIKEGLKIELAPEKNAEENEEDKITLFSMKTGDIISSDQVKLWSAKVFHMLNFMSEFGISVSREITSKNKQLYLTYYTSATNSKFATLLYNYLKEMISFVEQKKKGTISDEAMAEQEKKIREDISEFEAGLGD